MFVVTGATSNTGNAVANSLLDRGAPVRVIGRSLERLQPLVTRGAEPVIAEPSDGAALARAFDGATAVYAMLQPGVDPASSDFPAYQRAVIDAITSALAGTRVRRAVALSGWGANYEKVSNPLEGLRVLEARLRGIDRLRTLVLRPGWFMENALAFIRDIARTGAALGQLRGDLALPMIATADIGAVAADALVRGEFGEHGQRELEGPEPLSLDRAAAIVGELTGRPDARYSRISAEEARSRLLSSGFSAHMADAVVQMTDDVNQGRIRMVQPREARIITPTHFRSFAEAVLGKPAAAGGAAS